MICIQYNAQILRVLINDFTYVSTDVATIQIKIESISRSPRIFPGDPFQLVLSSLPARGNQYSDISHHRLTLRF